MSNNNPHGHLNQPTDNPSWNPLQIPSYIPRQPQLAHMSNERPMVRSPLAWHAPPPPDSIYNFMSANHKNLDHQMNPLLPPAFVRGPSPFDSMDLSLQSSRGSGSATLTKAGGMPTAQHEYAHQKHAQHQQQQQQQQQQLHANQHNQQQQQQMQHNTNVNYSPIHNLSTNPAASLIHPQHQQQQQQTHSNMPQHSLSGMQCASSVLTAGSNSAPKYMTSNGNECETTMLPPASVASNSSSNLTSSGAMTSPVHYMRDVESNYGKLAHLKRSYEANETNAMHKPVELVNKECPYPATMPNKLNNNQQQQQQHATSKKPSPLRNFHANSAHNQMQQQQHMPYGNTTPNKRNGPHTPPTPQSPIMHQASPTMPTHSAQQQHQMLANVGSLVGMSHGSSAAPLDFNQLHLQQQQQSVYGMQQATHQHQQHSQHLNFPAQHGQNQHQQQQQQQQQHRMHQMPAQQQQQSQHQLSQHQQSLHMQATPHLMHSPQTPPHQQSLQQQQQHHLTASRQQQQPHSPHMPHTPQPAQRSPLSQFTKRNEEQSQHPDSSPHGDLAVSQATALAVATAYSAYGESLRAKANIPDAPDSPDITTSNEESLDSNSNSSGGRLRRKRKSNNVMRIAHAKNENDHDADEVVSRQTAAQAPPPGPIEIQTTTTSNSNDNNAKSPVSSPPPLPQHKSPKRSSFTSPAAMAPSPLPLSTTPTMLLHQLNKTDSGQAQENGRRSPAAQPQATHHNSENEAEKIEKIASMLTKTTSNDNNSNSNFSHKSLDLSLFDSGSPKTKKQRQALKLRNAELLQTNSNGSTASSTFNEHANPSNDNAVQAADELQKETSVIKTISTTPVPQRPSRQTIDDTQSVSMERTLSPHSNSRSSSSSSSSSSCSRTTHSSNASHPKNDANVDAPQKQEVQAKAEEVGPTMDASAKMNTTPPTNESDQLDDDAKTDKPMELTKSSENSRELNDATSGANVPAIPAAPAVKPCTFEEVENKLEEMFAGIEDEPAAASATEDDEEPVVQAPANGTEIVKDLSLALALSTNANLAEKEKSELKAKSDAGDAVKAVAKVDIAETATKPETTQVATEAAEPEAKPEKQEPIANAATAIPIPTETVKENPEPEVVKVERPIATKAAKKSTESCLPVKAKTPPPQQSAETQEFPTKRLPPRRRLSVGMDPAFLRISIESQQELNTRSLQRGKKTEANNKLIAIHLDDEKPTTSAAAAAAAASLEAKTAKANGAKKNTNVSPPNNRNKAAKNAKGTATTNNKLSGTPSAPAALNASSANKKKKNTKKPSKQTPGQQKQKRKPANSSSSDESDCLPLSTTRDNLNNAAAQNASNTATTTPAAATIPTAHNGIATETKYKSPYVLIKKDGSISVINAPTAEDVNEKQTKKPMPKYTHDRKKIRGLHCSTLGNKYDADTIDSTWICVFCKRGPHKMGLGDLFGPYEVTINCDEYRCAVGQTDANDFDGEFASKRRRIDMVQTNARNLPVVPATLMHTKMAMATTHKKKKSLDDIAQLAGTMPLSTTASPAQLNLNIPADIKTEDDEETFLGMCKNSDVTYEVWMHEDCLVWAPDVFLVGARVTGLDAAVWSSQRYQCTLCANAGAMICCLQRDCKAPAHIPCARQANWHLDEKLWHVYCQKHIPNDVLNATSSMSALHALCTTPTAYS